MNETPRVILIGGATYDLQGQAFRELVPRDSNPGQITLGFGGVARNIAENLARLGVIPTLITAVGDDALGTELLAHAREAGIATDRILTVPGSRTAGYVALLDREGDMQLGLSDMGILDALTEDALEERISDIRPDDLAVLDTNLDEAMIAWLCRRLPCRVYADPISANKAPRLLSSMGRMDLVKPNRYEAEALTGLPVSTPEEARRAGERLRDLGARRVCINLSGGGAILVGPEGAVGLRARNVAVQSATGAGDAFMAGLILSDLEGRNPLETLKLATGCSLAALSSPHAVSRDLSRAGLETLLSSIELEVLL